MPTNAQIADIFTKIVSVSQHHILLSKLGVHNIFLPPNLRGSVEESNSWREISRKISRVVRKKASYAKFVTTLLVTGYSFTLCWFYIKRWKGASVQCVFSIR